MKKRGRRIVVMEFSGDVVESNPAYRMLMSNLRALQGAPPRAVVLSISGEGGSLSSAQHLCAEIDYLRKQGVFFAALIGETALSGTFHVSLAADWVFSQPGSIVGSIGAFVKHRDFSRMHERLGLAISFVTSGQFKDALSPHRPLSMDDHGMLTKVVEQSREQFLNYVVSRRRLSRAAVSTLADGSIFTGVDAAKHGLIDGHLSLSALLDKIFEHLDMQRPVVDIVVTDNGEKGGNGLYRFLERFGLHELLPQGFLS